MKVRNYEKKELIFLLIIITIILEITFFTLLFIEKENSYKKLTGILIKDDLVLVVVNKKERKILYSNRNLYSEDKKRKYRIIEDRGVLMTKDKKDFYEIVIKTSTNRKKKTNDTIDIAVQKNRFRLIEIFKLIWEGD